MAPPPVQSAIYRYIASTRRKSWSVAEEDYSSERRAWRQFAQNWRNRTPCRLRSTKDRRRYSPLVIGIFITRWSHCCEPDRSMKFPPHSSSFNRRFDLFTCGG